MAVIREFYAYVAEERPGEEGLIAYQMGDTMMPLIGADLERMASLQPYAEAAGRMQNVPVRLVRFTKRTVIQTWTPPKAQQ